MFKVRKTLRKCPDFAKELRDDLMAMARNPPTSKQFDLAESHFVRHVSQLPVALQRFYRNAYEVIYKAHARHVPRIINSIRAREHNFGINFLGEIDEQEGFGKCVVPVKHNFGDSEFS